MLVVRLARCERFRVAVKEGTEFLSRGRTDQDGASAGRVGDALTRWRTLVADAAGNSSTIAFIPTAIAAASGTPPAAPPSSAGFGRAPPSYADHHEWSLPFPSGGARRCRHQARSSDRHYKPISLCLGFPLDRLPSFWHHIPRGNAREISSEIGRAHV